MHVQRRSLKWLLISSALMILVLALSACSPAATEPASTATSAPTETATAAVEPTYAVPTATSLQLEGATTTDSGLQFLEITKGSGAAPNSGDLITMNYIASLPDGTELVNTYTNNEPVTTVWAPDRLLPGWEEGIGLMKEGGKAKMVLPAELAFGEQGSGAIPPNSQIVIEMDLVEVKAPPQPEDVAADQMTKTESGLQYYDITEGEGTLAEKNSNVTTEYTLWIQKEGGYEYIDASGSDNAIQFVIGRGDMVFPGWEEGATGMKVGGKRLLVIPPDLALGEQGSGIIPPNATLVMEIGLTDVIEPRVPTKVDESDYTTTDSGLKYYDLVEGTGETPTSGQTVVVHYTGWLTDGTQFDSSLDSGQPFSFQLGTGNVIAGWEEGVATMKVGGKRQLVIPADLAYGEQGAGSVIPPGATLVFEVELLEIQQ